MREELRKSEALKVTRTFRLSPETVDILKRTAEEMNLSQGDIIEDCILEKLSEVVAKHRDRRAALKDPAATKELATRKVLTKRQAN